MANCIEVDKVKANVIETSKLIIRHPSNPNCRIKMVACRGGLQFFLQPDSSSENTVGFIASCEDGTSAIFVTSNGKNIFMDSKELLQLANLKDNIEKIDVKQSEILAALDSIDASLNEQDEWDKHTGGIEELCDLVFGPELNNAPSGDNKK